METMTQPEVRSISGTAQFLQMQADFVAKNCAGQRCLSQFILQHGRPFTETADCKRGPMGECYRNAALMAIEDHDMIYCEGYAVASKVIPLPLAHAWCVNREGAVFDPTWKDGIDYFGIPFKRSFLTRRLIKQKRYGLIDCWEFDFPVLRLPEEQWKEIL